MAPMATKSAPAAWSLIRQPALIQLAGTTAGLAAGGILWIAGSAQAGKIAWLCVSLAGLAYAIWTMADSLRRHRVGVDLLAVLAIAGAIAVRELLAAAVISVMLASGRALESWSARRARRDLTGLLERVPRTARLYRGRSLATVPLEEIEPGQLVLVAQGDVIPADGTVESEVA